MSEERLATLERAVAAAPEDILLRSRLYRELVRLGLCPESAVERAAYHKDPAAQIYFKGRALRKSIKSDQDLLELQNLPIQKLSHKEPRSLTSVGLQVLKGKPIHTFKFNAVGSFAHESSKLWGCLPLRELSIHLCPELDDKVLPPLQNLSSLRTLSLCHSTISGPGLRNLRRCSIETLYLRSVLNLSDSDLAQLAELPLKVLDLSATGISDKALEHLKALPLKILRLRSNDFITGSGFSWLQGLPLRILNLEKTTVQSEHLSLLKAAPMESLNLSFNPHIDDEGLKALRGFRLKKLNLHQCPSLTGEGLQWLESSSLEQLDLAHTRKLSGEGLRFLRGHPLKVLSLRCCVSLQGSNLGFLETLPLEELSLRFNRQIKSDRLRFLNKIQSLKKLVLYNTNASAETLVLLPRENLESLNLAHCELIPPPAFALLKDFQLRELNASYTQIDDASLAQLAALPFESLTIKCCKNLTEAGLQCLKDTPLKKLDCDFPDTARRLLSSTPRDSL